MPAYLVVASQTVDSDELIEAVRKLAEATPSEFTLVVPATPVSHLATWTEGESLALATERADRAEAKLEAAGVNVVDTGIGDPSPYQAVQDALLQRSFDAIIVSTFPLRSSRWLRMDLVHRLERTVAVPVIHVVAHSKA